MQAKKLFQILLGIILIGAFLAVGYYLAREYGWFEKSTESMPAEKQKTLKQILFEKGSAPPDAESTLTEEERKKLIEDGSAPPNAKSSLTEEERKELIRKGTAP